MGRPMKPHRPWTIHHYVRGQLCCEPLDELGRASRKQRYFECLCRKHFTLRTVQGVNDDPRTLVCRQLGCLACRCCPPLQCRCQGGAYASCDAKASGLRAMGLHVQTALELHCARLLRRYEGEVVIAESQCLDIERLRSGTRCNVSHIMVDFFLVSMNLCIMVDGVHHFKGSCHGRTAEEQQMSDARFDMAVLEEDRRLLRLHHIDIAAWPVALARAVQRARQDRHSSWIECTTSYPAERQIMREKLGMYDS